MKQPSIVRRHVMATGFGPPQSAADRDWLAGFVTAPDLLGQVRQYQLRVWLVFVVVAAGLGLAQGVGWWWAPTLGIGVFLGVVAWRQGPSAIMRARDGLAAFDAAHRQVEDQDARR